jgi:hypothetical protein
METSYELPPITAKLLELLFWDIFSPFGKKRSQTRRRFYRDTVSGS